MWCAGSDDESDEEDDDIGSSLSDGDDEEPVDHAELIAQVTGGEVQLRRQERSEGPLIAHNQSTKPNRPKYTNQCSHLCSGAGRGRGRRVQTIWHRQHAVFRRFIC